MALPFSEISFRAMSQPRKECEIPLPLAYHKLLYFKLAYWVHTEYRLRTKTTLFGAKTDHYRQVTTVSRFR